MSAGVSVWVSCACDSKLVSKASYLLGYFFTVMILMAFNRNENATIRLKCDDNSYLVVSELTCGFLVLQWKNRLDNFITLKSHWVSSACST